MNTTTEQLTEAQILDMIKPFCGSDETRPGIMVPFNQSGFTFATDGRIMVRVPMLDIVPESEHRPPTNAGSVLPNVDGAIWTHLPPIPANEVIECESCNGEGDCYCHHCGDHKCGECDGLGEVNRKITVTIGARKLDAFYLRKIASLPNPQVVEAGDKETAMAFRFDGGIGCLMPIRVN